MKRKGNAAEFHVPLPVDRVSIHDPFWDHWIGVNRDVTLPYQYEQLEASGRIANFLKASGNETGRFQGMNFNDSDVYKWIEAASYELLKEYSPELEEKIDRLIDIIIQAQDEDGYLHTYIMIEEPDKRWTNLGMMHELYCAGHLIEAAAAHYQATGSTKLLNAACRFADLIHDEFITKGRTGVPGHEEIELALIRLYRITEEQKYFNLAKCFIDRRGTLYSSFRKELSQLESISGYGLTLPVDNFEPKAMHEFYGEYFRSRDGTYDGRYAQDHLPLRQQKTVEGHAVRAMYLYCAAADIASETGDEQLFSALDALWENMTSRRMYVTGGIGSSSEMEGFTGDFHLPNETAYAETCAAIGSILWNHRMLLITRDGKYADVMERVLFNGFLSGVSYRGKEFFYVNPLSAESNHRRKGWFSVACCPTNAVRILSSLGQFIYSQTRLGLYVHHYIASTAAFQIGENRIKVIQSGGYPIKGDIAFTIHTETPAEFTLYFRKPGWCRGFDIFTAASETQHRQAVTERGYAAVKRIWKDGDRVILRMDLPIELVRSHPQVSSTARKRAVQRGPVIYCIESADNSGSLDLLTLSHPPKFTLKSWEGMPAGALGIEGNVLQYDLSSWQNLLYCLDEHTVVRKATLRAIPYHLWANRTPGQMRVWIPCRCCGDNEG